MADKVAPNHLLREAQTALFKSSEYRGISQVGEADNDFYVVMKLKLGRLMELCVENL